MSYGKNQQIPVVIDIETLAEPLSASALKKFEADYEPHKTLKDPALVAEHKDKKREEYDAKTRFRFDRQRPISVAVATADGTLGSIDGFVSSDSKKVASFLAEWLADLGAPFKFVGFNIEAFDLPILARWSALAGCSWRYKIDKWGTVDLFLRPFAKSIGLKAAAEAYGIDPGTVTGADVAIMASEGKWDEILKYNKHDVYMTGTLYLKLKGMYDI